MFDTLIRRIFELSASQPDKTAVAFKKETLTYQKLAQKIRAIGTNLAHMGIKRGDRVLFTALSKPEMAATYLGIQYCGAVAVFMDKNGTPENSAAVYEDAQAVLFLTDKPMKGLENRIRLFSLKQLYATEAPGEILEYIMPDENDMAELLFTTGTTGKPKGVILSYKSVYHILSNTIEGTGILEEERMLLPLPLNHSFALRVLRATLYIGATAVLQNGFAFAREIEQNQEAFDCTALAAVPASMEILRSQMQDAFPRILGKFRYIEIGAGSLTIEQKKRLTDQLLDTRLLNTWGSSESGGALFLDVNNAVKNGPRVGAVGKPLPQVKVRVLDENGIPMNKSDADHPGRMALKGDMVMAGYWHRDELTAQTLKDGWLITSDMVYTDADGYVYMLGRADDIINVGGEKVSPVELENIASEYPPIRECACIGVNDPNGVLGQVPVLFVVTQDILAPDKENSADNGLKLPEKFSEAGIQTFFASRMERYKLPQHYVTLTELPRNRMGKIDRKKLREIWENQGEKDLMNPVLSAILARRSIRKFTDKPVPRKLLDMLLMAAYHAPSGHNMQTWRFSVLQNAEKIAQLKAAITEVAKKKKVSFYGFEQPPCLILISNDVRNADGCQDASCAAQNIFLAAHSYGLGSVWLNALMTLCDEPEIRLLLTSYGIPQNHRVWCMAAVGYPAAPGVTLAKKKDVVFYVD
ncbi:MAG: AMP-binding protein [Lachnospiraceae bacterium]|nr:AMP-binding protein [Lachnospiraceae bacterium]